MNLCYHTYGRWVEKQLVCAVCGTKLDEKYNANFVGTFPVDKLHMANQFQVPMVWTTHTAAPRTCFKLDDE
jgi:hypothetical protein